MADKGGIHRGNYSSSDNTIAYPYFNPITEKYNVPKNRSRRDDSNPLVEYNQIMNQNYNIFDSASHQVTPQTEYKNTDIRAKSSRTVDNSTQMKTTNLTHNHTNPEFHSVSTDQFMCQKQAPPPQTNNMDNIRSSINFLTKQAYRKVL